MSQEQTPRPARQPEKKIGPFAGGISVAIWLNTADTPDGPRAFRSVTISPRRYLDRESGEWKDASSYNPGQLPALVFALQKALEFVLETPLPDQKVADAEARAPDEIPF
jgi:hypothetical protein